MCAYLKSRRAVRIFQDIQVRLDGVDDLRVRYDEILSTNRATKWFSLILLQVWCLENIEAARTLKSRRYQLRILFEIVARLYFASSPVSKYTIQLLLEDNGTRYLLFHISTRETS